MAWSLEAMKQTYLLIPEANVLLRDSVPDRNQRGWMQAK